MDRWNCLEVNAGPPLRAGNWGHSPCLEGLQPNYNRAYYRGCHTMYLLHFEWMTLNELDNWLVSFGVLMVNQLDDSIY